MKSYTLRYIFACTLCLMVPAQGMDADSNLVDDDDRAQRESPMYAIAQRALVTQASNIALHLTFESYGLIDPVNAPCTTALTLGAAESLTERSFTHSGLISDTLPAYVGAQALANLTARYTLKKMLNDLIPETPPSISPSSSQSTLHAVAQVALSLGAHIASGYVTGQIVDQLTPRIATRCSQALGNFGRNYTEKETLIRTISQAIALNGNNAVLPATSIRFWNPDTDEDPEMQLIALTQTIKHRKNNTAQDSYTYTVEQKDSNLIVTEKIQLKYWRELWQLLPNAPRYFGADNSYVKITSSYGTLAADAAFWLPYLKAKDFKPSMHNLYNRVRERHVLVTGKPLKDLIPEIGPEEQCLHLDL